MKSSRILPVAAFALAFVIALAAAPLDINSPVVAAPPTSVITTSLNAAATTQAIQSCAFLARETVVPEVEMRLETAEKAVDQLHSHVAASNSPTKGAFEVAYNEAQVRQKAVHSSLDAAIRARNESDWDDARAALARDYAAYANAVAQAEDAGKISGPIQSEP